jgi:hypothetical protein
MVWMPSGLPVAPVQMALHQLPPPADFTGRTDELDDLLGKISAGGVTISGLRGMGGIGKTARALKLADQLKASFPNAQIYLDLRGTDPQPLTAADARAHVIRAYQPTARLPENEAELSGLYYSVLHNQRALLVMDNAASAEQIAPLIPGGLRTNRHLALSLHCAGPVRARLGNIARGRLAQATAHHSAAHTRRCGTPFMRIS